MPKYKKAIVWDWDGPINYQTGLPTDKHYPSQKYPVKHDIYIADEDELATALDILAANNILSIIGSQRIGYAKKPAEYRTPEEYEEEKDFKDCVFDTVDKAFKPKGKYFLQNHSEILSQNITNAADANATGNSKNVFLKAVTSIPGCKHFKPSDITLVDDNEKYEKPAVEAGYNFIYAPASPWGQPSNIRHIAEVLVKNIDGKDIYSLISKYAKTKKAGENLIREVIRYKIESKIEKGKEFAEIIQAYNNLNNAKEEAAHKDHLLKSYLRNDPTFTTALSTMYDTVRKFDSTYFSELSIDQNSILKLTKAMYSCPKTNISTIISEIHTDPHGKRMPNLPFNKNEEGIITDFVDKLHGFNEKLEQAISEKEPGRFTRFLHIVTFGLYKRKEIENFESTKKYQTKLVEDIRTLVNTDYCKMLKVEGADESFSQECISKKETLGFAAKKVEILQSELDQKIEKAVVTKVEKIDGANKTTKQPDPKESQKLAI